MDVEKIFEKVSQVIRESCDIEFSEIKLSHTLFDELAIDSIDLVDILFELETEYDISLKISDIGKQAKLLLGPDVEYEVDGVITKEGLEVLKSYMTEIPSENFKQGLSVYDLIKLFTVESLCKLIQKKLSETK